MTDTPEATNPVEGLEYEAETIRAQFETNTAGENWDPKTAFEELLRAEQQVAMARAEADGSKMSIATADMLEESVADQEDPALAARRRFERYKKAVQNAQENSDDIHDNKVGINGFDEPADQLTKEVDRRIGAFSTAITNYQKAADALAPKTGDDTALNAEEQETSPLDVDILTDDPEVIYGQMLQRRVDAAKAKGDKELLAQAEIDLENPLTTAKRELDQATTAYYRSFEAGPTSSEKQSLDNRVDHLTAVVEAFKKKEVPVTAEKPQEKALPESEPIAETPEIPAEELFDKVVAEITRAKPATEGELGKLRERFLNEARMAFGNIPGSLREQIIDGSLSQEQRELIASGANSKALLYSRTQRNLDTDPRKSKAYGHVPGRAELGAYINQRMDILGEKAGTPIEADWYGNVTSPATTEIQAEYKRLFLLNSQNNQ